ncbi:MAG: hypothetical protein AAGA18_14740 [Verrucomicrobiota bacterium]
MDLEKYNPLIAECQKLKNSGHTSEQLVVFLKEKGMIRTESLYILTQVLGIDGGAAKKLVFGHDVWKDKIQDDEEFHKNIDEALKELDSS